MFTEHRGLTLFDFDPAAFQVSNKVALPRTPNGKPLTFEGAIWSGLNPGILYGFEGSTLWECDVTGLSLAHPQGAKYTQLYDFSTSFPGSELWQMSKSRDDEVFAVSLCTQGTCSTGNRGGVVGYCVWRRAQQQFILEQTRLGVDEVHLDKTGHFLVVVNDNGPNPPATAIAMQVWDLTLATPAATDLTDGAPDYAPGHYDTGTGVLIGHDRYNNRTTLRNLSAPHHVTTTVLQMLNDWSQDYHVSLLADDEEHAVISFYTEPATPPGLFHNEVVQVSTDGHETLCRLAHHRSRVREDADIPHANVSGDRRFVAFNSNWEGTGQRDVFIVKVPAQAP